MRVMLLKIPESRPARPDPPAARTSVRTTPAAAPRRHAAIAAVGASLIALSGIWVALGGLPPVSSAFARTAYALPVLLLIAARESRRRGSPATTRQRHLGLLAGLFFTGDLVLWHTSIDLIGAGMATVLAAGQVVIVPVAAWMLYRERPAPRTLAAIPVVLVGIVVISGVLGTPTFGSNPGLGAVLGVAASACYAGFLLALRHANAGGDRPAGALGDATAGAVLGTLVVAAATGHLADLIPAWPSAGWMLTLAMGSQVVAWLMITASLPRLPSAVSSLILTLQPVLSVLFGALILAERPTAVQLLGVLLVIAAVAWAGARPRTPRLLTSP